MKSNQSDAALLYSKIQREGFQGYGNGLIDKKIEKFSHNKRNKRILEIGGSSGEHIQYITKENFFQWSSYEILDLEPGETNPKLFHELGDSGVVFTRGSCERMPYQDSVFDMVLMTCVLAHLSNVEKCLFEIRRVLSHSGVLVIGLPCDPGFLNRTVKKFITYPKMKKYGITNPKLDYARNHRNGISNLLTLIEHVFSSDDLNVRFYPFRLRSWNFNLFALVIVNVIKLDVGSVIQKKECHGEFMHSKHLSECDVQND